MIPCSWLTMKAEVRVVELEALRGSRVQARASALPGVPLQHRSNGLPNTVTKPDHRLYRPDAPLHRDTHHHLCLLHQTILNQSKTALTGWSQFAVLFLKKKKVRRTSRGLGLVREAAGRELLNGESGAKTSKQVCGRSSGGGGGDGGESWSKSSGTAWTRTPIQSAGSDAERARARTFPSRRVRDRDDGPSGAGRTAVRTPHLPLPLLRRRREGGDGDEDGDAAAGDRPTRTAASRDRLFLRSGIAARILGLRAWVGSLRCFSGAVADWW